ncbi:Alpha-ketoglutarate-dependent dioxygenase alkB 6 [Podochytrium sp. JEL0797]|nr:Alpha-ketoglutarate-dependent dioxygenase alkB 6 [Podochytrium sp. JEL0797]
MISKTPPLTVTPVPPTFTYIPDFITIEEEQRLLAKVASAPLPKWTSLKNRRLQNWGSTPIAAKGNTALKERMPDWLESLAARICTENPMAFRFGEAQQLVPNHCLVNEYNPGQGIMPHLDGPAYKPTVATVSLGEYTVLEFFKRRNLDDSMTDSMDANDSDPDDVDESPKRRKPDFRFLIQRRSLVILQDEMYECFLHGIAENSEDEVSAITINNWSKTGLDGLAKKDGSVILKRIETRVSLTFRVAAKVSKLNLFGKKR